MIDSSGAVTLALPSKGALYDGTLSLMARCGLPVYREGRGRGYFGRIKHLDQLRVQFLRAEEIPLRVDTGDILVGVSGLDLCQESCPDSDSSHVLIPSLGFGYARLVVAVPKIWIDVENMNDLGEVAARMKREHGRGLRVGTKFHQLTRRLFAERSIRDYVIVDSRGATEGMPASGAADVIVDLTSSGTTLVENDLKELIDGTAVESEACLVVHSRASRWSDEALEVLGQLVECLEAGLRARKRSLIHFTIQATQLADVTRVLASTYGCEIGWEPTIKIQSRHAEELPVWTGVVCPARSVYPAIRYLKQSGGGSISVLNPELMFSDSFETLSAFKQLLRHREQ